MIHRERATILTATARGPTAAGRVAELYQETHDERMDQDMADYRNLVGDCRARLRRRAATVSQNGTGYAVGTAGG